MTEKMKTSTNTLGPSVEQLRENARPTLWDFWGLSQSPLKTNL